MSTQPNGTQEGLKSVEQQIDEYFVQPKITGYRQLNTEEVALMNEIKALGNDIGRMVEGMMLNPKLDTRWVAAACTTLQTGFMQLTRAVAQPTSF